MHFLIIGATGRTGELVVDKALSENHTVTALARNPSSITPRKGLTITKGTPLSAEDINNTFDSSDKLDAIIVTLNARRASDSPFSKTISPPRFMADSVANIRTAMSAHGVRKLVIMSAVGVGDSYPSLNFLMKPIISYSNMSAQYADHNLVDEETRKSGLDWVLVRPTMLKGEEEKEVKELGDRGEKAGFMPSVSRKSVAAFLVRAAEREEWNGRSPVICN